MASIWEQYGFNGQFLQPTYIPFKPHIGETIILIS